MNRTIIERLRYDETATLNALYVQYYRTSVHYVLQHAGSEDDAKDIYQEAFLAVWRNVQLGRFVPADEQEFGAYLARVCKNKWIDELRRRRSRRMPVTDEQASASAVPDTTDEIDTYIDAVKRNYRHLGTRCRELLHRFYFRRQRLRKIADDFGWTEASAKNNKYRCLKQLRELVIKEGGN
ncbi:RNA polymerase sigma factor [Parapedobacter koreensis]|nr:sigma-70 family RNA polymerase sigma factor [Parapedobacter koreensis]